jgi:hypothetical protein
MVTMTLSHKGVFAIYIITNGAIIHRMNNNHNKIVIDNIIYKVNDSVFRAGHPSFFSGHRLHRYPFCGFRTHDIVASTIICANHFIRSSATAVSYSIQTSCDLGLTCLVATVYTKECAVTHVVNSSMNG